MVVDVEKRTADDRLIYLFSRDPRRADFLQSTRLPQWFRARQSTREHRSQLRTFTALRSSSIAPPPKGNFLPNFAIPKAIRHIVHRGAESADTHCGSMPITSHLLQVCGITHLSFVSRRRGDEEGCGAA